MDSNPNSPTYQSMGASLSSSSSPQQQTLDPKPDPVTSTPTSPKLEESLPPDAESGGVPTEGAEVIEGPDGGGKVEEEEEQEEGECGFCLFMKAGGCRDEFIDWEKCVQDAENDGGDIAERCFEVTSMLKKCMDAHADYYEPVLRAEKAMADSITEDAEKEKAQDESKKASDAPEEKVEVITITESEN